MFRYINYLIINFARANISLNFYENMENAGNQYIAKNGCTKSAENTLKVQLMQHKTDRFALGIIADSPQPPTGGEDLQRIARPEGERPTIKKELEIMYRRLNSVSITETPLPLGRGRVRADRKSHIQHNRYFCSV